MATSWEVVTTHADGRQMLVAVGDRIAWSRRHAQRIAAGSTQTDHSRYA